MTRPASGRVAARPEVYGLRISGLDDVVELQRGAGDDRAAIDVEIGQRNTPPPAASTLGADGGVRLLADGRHLDVRRDPGTATFYGPPLARDLLAHPYLGPVATTFNRWAGREAFHAGAFEVGGRAWVVVGERTAGKSTLLAALAGRGIPVVSDDIVITDGFCVHAGPRCIDLREPVPGSPLAAVPARLGTRLRVPLPGIDSRTDLGGWLFLGWGEQSLTPVGADELLSRLARRRTWVSLASDPMTLLQLASFPAWDLARPRDWSVLPATLDRLLATVEGSCRRSGGQRDRGAAVGAGRGSPADIDSTPAAVARRRTLATAARCLALDAAAAAAVRILDTQGIASMVLKGPAIAHRLYPGDPGSRAYRDVDLLVAPGTFAVAEHTLAGHGYRPAMPGARSDDLLWHEREWRVPGQAGLIVDLHRGFAGVEDAEAFWSNLWSTADTLALFGAPVAVPDAAASALLLGLHAAAPGSSGQPVADLLRALEVVDPDTWRRAATLGLRTRSEVAFAVGLRLVPGGIELAQQLDLPTAATPLTWLRARPHDPTAFALAKLAAVPTFGGRLQLLRRRLVPSPASMRSRHPRADQGFGALAGAYLHRLASLAVGLPRGLHELRAATVAARGSSWVRSPGTASRLRPAMRGVRRGDIAGLLAGVWALRACRAARSQLAADGLAGVALRPAPPAGASGERVVAAVLRRFGASCLEGSVVRQCWFADQGIARELVIGVSAPGPGFHAHAWLDGETSADHHNLIEIHRRMPTKVPGRVRQRGTTARRVTGRHGRRG